MKKLIIKRLTGNLIWTFFLSCILTTLSVLIYCNKQLGSLEGNSGALILIIGGFIYSFIQTILSATVYLNIYNKISSNTKLNFLTFFLLPVLFTGFMVYYKGEMEMNVLYLILTLPFILTQFFSYAHFKRFLRGLEKTA